jgi:hypothetical protein
MPSVRWRCMFAANHVRFIIATAILLWVGAASAEMQMPDSSATPHSTGRTVAPEVKGQKQPQGYTGPLETTGPAAPAASPQGQTPPGMQAAPEGSSKTTVAPER